MTGQRVPAGHMNYPGDVTGTFDMDRSYGPTTFGEQVWPVSIEYDAEKDQTRVGFSYLAPTP